MSDDPLWSVYEAYAGTFDQHAQDSAYNAHYDRPAASTKPDWMTFCPIRTGNSTRRSAPSRYTMSLT